MRDSGNGEGVEADPVRGVPMRDPSGRRNSHICSTSAGRSSGLSVRSCSSSVSDARESDAEDVPVVRDGSVSFDVDVVSGRSTAASSSGNEYTDPADEISVMALILLRFMSGPLTTTVGIAPELDGVLLEPGGGVGGTDIGGGGVPGNTAVAEEARRRLPGAEDCLREFVRIGRGPRSLDVDCPGR